MGRPYLITIMIVALCAMNSIAQNSDCTTALRICELETYSFTPKGAGQIQEPLSRLKNSNNHKETNSIWLFWDVESEGDFVFELDPKKGGDDIDFTVFKSISNDCEGMKQIRSVLSGANLPSYANSEKCIGITGLSYGSDDLQEGPGCQKNQDNFAKFVTASNSERYYILINNYGSANEFEFKLSGSLLLDNSACTEAKSVASTVEGLTVYPNPVSDELYINVSTTEQIVDMSIIDMLGRRVINLEEDNYGHQESQKTNVKSLLSGTYIVRVETQVGVMERRFVRL